MNIEALPIAGAFVVTPSVFDDERGYFKEVFSARRYEEAIGVPHFVQDNVSKSVRGVLRGLHAARGMAKLVQALNGTIYDVIVDIRADSATKGRWHGIELDGGSHRQVFVPDGCLHGFLTLSDDALVLYKQSAYYDPDREIGIAWDDPELAIAWPLHGKAPSLSPKDARNPRLHEAALL